MSVERKTVAVLGAGYFAHFHLDAWLRMDAVDVIGVADQNPARLTDLGVQGFASLVDLLSARLPDILDIVTPPDTHAAAITCAIAAAVPTVICQKPFCTSLDEARRTTLQARQAGIKVIIHENFRFQPWYRVMRQAIDGALLGEVQNLTFRLRTGDGQGSDAYLARQPYFQTMPRFLVQETAVHWVDTFRYLLGDPSAVYADLRRLNPVIAGEDAGHILFDFPNGARALFDGNRLLDHATRNPRLTFGEALLEGPEGAITLAGDGAVRFRAFGAIEERVLLPAKDYAGFAGDCVHALQSHVVEALNGLRPFENLAQDYLRVLEIVSTIYLSAANGTKQRIFP